MCVQNTSTKYIYTTHVHKPHKYIQVLFCLLPSKSEACYVQMWEFIKQIAQKEICPKLVVLDFEQAAHSAVRKVFPNCRIKGCCFHWGQALFRKIQALELKSEYSDPESEIGKWLKLFFGLPLLPPDEVNSAIDDLIIEQPHQIALREFSEYV